MASDRIEGSLKQGEGKLTGDEDRVDEGQARRAVRALDLASLGRIIPHVPTIRRLALITGAAAASATLATAGGAPAAPERDLLIRMGKGIGKVDLGMTLPQVRRALGRRHQTVARRIDFGARGRYVELGWELPGRRPWEPDAWLVGFRSGTRGGALRVVRVSTGARSERTPKRIGVGARPADIVRAYPDATCVSRGEELAYRYDWIVVEGGGGMTAFSLSTVQTWQAAGDPRVVVGVMVQRDWFSRGPGHRPCRPGWQRW